MMGDEIFENQPNCSKVIIREFFGVADDESRVRFLKLKMVDPIWRKLNNPIHYTGFDILNFQNRSSDS